MKRTLKTLGTALLGGAIALGGYKAIEEDRTVTIEKVPENYAKVTSFEGSAEKEAARADLPFNFASSAEAVTPTVVHISSRMQREASRQEIPAPFRDFFGEDFFRQRPRQSQATGSGVIVSEDGYIVTNNHVIAKADEVTVTLHDKREFDAKVVGTDPYTDLAVIKIEEGDLPKIALANSDEVKVGEWVMAVGNPFNLSSTVTAGIVSAKARNINILKDNAAIESFIQTDAAVNPGNSGGALVNARGELIGINTAISSPTGTYAGYAFAVPSNIVSKVAKDLIEYGKVQRAYLGVMIRDVNAELKKEENLEVLKGVYVDSLVDTGAAAKAGIKLGDVITAVNGEKVNSVAELQEAIARKRPGDEVTITLLRNSRNRDIEVELKNRMGTDEIVEEKKSEVLRTLGAAFEELNEKQKKELNLRTGVMVKKLYAGKLRAETDIREGFIITKINKEPVNSAQELEALLKNQRGGVLIEGVYPDAPDEIKYYGFGL